MKRDDSRFSIIHSTTKRKKAHLRFASLVVITSVKIVSGFYYHVHFRPFYLPKPKSITFQRLACLTRYKTH